ncbi:acyltransferase [Novosphingobium sp. RD2P27]|uniref:Acyltransferase n=1 Tax=Novosphingobium kalidii TaxID=3230299 RepID=A0ABV2D2K7_9SPHN
MRIISVQALRALAAFSVLTGHALGAAASTGELAKPALPYGAGVDLFFAISGFIMVYSAQRIFTHASARKEFLIKRAARVVPLYWGATTALLAVMILTLDPRETLPPVSYIAASYFFIPNDAYGSAGGIPFPLLSLGWTLNYEMLFYAVFSIFIFLPRSLATLGVQITLLAAVGLGLLLEPTSIVLSTWTQPIILEFALGVTIANALLSGARLPITFSTLLVIFACFWLLLDPFGLLSLDQTPNDFRRLGGWGLPAALILGGVVLGRGQMSPRLEKPAALLGDASYSLYLTHPFILIPLEHAWLGLLGPRHLHGMVMIGIVLAIAFSIAVNRVIEKPMVRLLHRVRPSIRRDAIPAAP